MSDPETPAAIVEFTAAGPVRTVAAAIEAYAAERRIVSALVVPWESDAVTLRMAVTSMKSEGWAIEHTNLGTISLADLGGDLVRIAVVAAEAGSGASSLTTFARQIERKFSTICGIQRARGSMTPSDEQDRIGLIPDLPKNEGASLFSASVTLRVTEARVDDVGRATARLAAPDLVRIGARPGDVLQITGRLVAVARAELQAPAEPETIQIDGTVRGNGGAGLQELVSVTRVEHSAAVSVRLASVGGSTPTAISTGENPRRSPGRPRRDRSHRPSADVRQGGEFPGDPHDSIGTGRHRSADRSAGHRGRAVGRAGARYLVTRMSAASSGSWRESVRSSNCR